MSIWDYIDLDDPMDSTRRWSYLDEEEEDDWKKYALPASQAYVPQDVGLGEFALSSLNQNLLVPFKGIGERMGLREEGATQQEIAEHQRLLEDYLATSDNPELAAAMAGITEGLSMAAPMLGAGGVGARAGVSALGKLAPRATLGTARAVAGAAAGATEGGLAGLGMSAGTDNGLESTLLGIGAGAALGGAAGRFANSQAADDLIRKYVPEVREDVLAPQRTTQSVQDRIREGIAQREREKSEQPLVGVGDAAHDELQKRLAALIDRDPDAIFDTAAYDELVSFPLPEEKGLLARSIPSQEKIKSGWQKFYRFMVNDWQPVEAVGDVISRLSGSDIEKEQLRRLAQITRGTSGAARAHVYDEPRLLIDGQYVSATVDPLSKGGRGPWEINQDLPKLGLTQRDISDVWRSSRLAEFADEKVRGRAGDKDPAKLADDESPWKLKITDTDIKAAQEYLDAKRLEWGDAKFEAARAKAKQWSNFAHDAHLLPQLRSGAISEQSYKNIVDRAGEYWAPLEKVSFVDDLEPIGSMSPIVRGGPTPRKLKGRQELARLADPIDVTMARAQRAFEFQTREAVRKEFASIVLDNPQAADELGIRILAGEKPKLGEETFTVHMDGEKIEFSAPKEIAELMETGSSDEAKWLMGTLINGNPIGRGMRNAAQLLRVGATYSPNFPLRNLVRDQWSAAVNSRYGYNPFINFADGALEVLANEMPTLRKALDKIGYGDGVNYAEVFDKQGGSQSTFVRGGEHQHLGTPVSQTSMEDISKRLMESELGENAGLFYRELEEIKRATKKHGALGAVAEVAKAPFKLAYRGAEKFADVTEQATRVGAAKKALKKTKAAEITKRLRDAGMADTTANREYVLQTLNKESNGQYLGNIRAAVDEGREATVDFRRAGWGGRTWNSIEAFANAEIQDWDKFGRLMTDPKRRMKTIAQVNKWVVLPTLAHWMYHKDDKDYEEIPQWERLVYFHVGKTEDGSWIRIPRPLGPLGIVSMMTEKTLDAAYDQTGRSPEWTAIRNKHSPLHYITDEEGRLNMTDFIPTAAEPITEVSYNYDSFRGTQIEPEYMRDTRLTEDRTRSTTSDVAKVLARATQAANGGEGGFSPIQMDHLIQGHTSTIGNLATDLVDKSGVLNPLLGETADLEVERKWFGESPMLGTAFGSRPAVGYRSRSVQDFYKELEKAEQAEGSYKEALEGGNIERANLMLNNYPNLLYAKSLRSVRKKLSEIYQQKTMVRDDPSLTPAQRRQRIDELDALMTEITSGALDSLGLR